MKIVRVVAAVIKSINFPILKRKIIGFFIKNT